MKIEINLTALLAVIAFRLLAKSCCRQIANRVSMLSFRRHLMMDGNLRLHIPRMKSIMVVEGRRRLCRRGSSLTFSLSGHSVVNGIITPSHIKMNLSVFSFIFLVASKKTLKLLVVAKCSINQNIYKFSSFTQKPPRDSTYFSPSLSLFHCLLGTGKRSMHLFGDTRDMETCHYHA